MAQEIDRSDFRRRVGEQIVRQGNLFLGQAQSIDQQVARHLEQPGTRVFHPTEVGALQHRTQEDLLQEIVGIARAAGTMHSYNFV